MDNQEPRDVIPISSDTTTDGPGAVKATTVGYHKMATENWVDTTAPNAKSLIDDTATADRNRAIFDGPFKAPEAAFKNDKSVALQVKRFADGTLNELEVKKMISEVNEGQDPYIVAPLHKVTITDMLHAFAKYAAEKAEKAESGAAGPKEIIVLVGDDGRRVVYQDGKLYENAEERLLQVGLKPVDK